MKEKHICCICGEEFEGFGNNPYPVDKEEGARCCDECNDEVVIPARINDLKEEKEEEYYEK